MSTPMNEPSHVLYREPTNNQMNNQMAFGHNKLKLNMAFGCSELIELILAFGCNELFELMTTNSNTSCTFEAVNGMNQDHDKIKVDNRVTLKDSRDDEIQCGSREQPKTQSDWQRPKQQSSLYLPVFPLQLFVLISVQD
jgi:hypothetical protein